MGLDSLNYEEFFGIRRFLGKNPVPWLSLMEDDIEELEIPFQKQVSYACQFLSGSIHGWFKKNFYKLCTMNWGEFSSIVLGEFGKSVEDEEGFINEANTIEEEIEKGDEITDSVTEKMEAMDEQMKENEAAPRYLSVWESPESQKDVAHRSIHIEGEKGLFSCQAQQVFDQMLKRDIVSSFTKFVRVQEGAVIAPPYLYHYGRDFQVSNMHHIIWFYFIGCPRSIYSLHIVIKWIGNTLQCESLSISSYDIKGDTLGTTDWQEGSDAVGAIDSEHSYRLCIFAYWQCHRGHAQQLFYQMCPPEICSSASVTSSIGYLCLFSDQHQSLANWSLNHGAQAYFFTLRNEASVHYFYWTAPFRWKPKDISILPHTESSSAISLMEPMPVAKIQDIQSQVRRVMLILGASNGVIKVLDVVLLQVCNLWILGLFSSLQYYYTSWRSDNVVTFSPIELITIVAATNEMPVMCSSFVKRWFHTASYTFSSTVQKIANADESDDHTKSMLDFTQGRLYQLTTTTHFHGGGAHQHIGHTNIVGLDTCPRPKVGKITKAYRFMNNAQVIGCAKDISMSNLRDTGYLSASQNICYRSPPARATIVSDSLSVIVEIILYKYVSGRPHKCTRWACLKHFDTSHFLEIFLVNVFNANLGMQFHMPGRLQTGENRQRAGDTLIMKPRDVVVNKIFIEVPSNFKKLQPYTIKEVSALTGLSMLIVTAITSQANRKLSMKGVFSGPAYSVRSNFMGFTLGLDTMTPIREKITLNFDSGGIVDIFRLVVPKGKSEFAWCLLVFYCILAVTGSNRAQGYANQQREDNFYKCL